MPVRDHPNLKTPLKRGEKYSIFPAYTVDGYMAWMVQFGSTQITDFNAFVRRSVLPLMNPFPMERSVLIIDNNNTQHSEVSLFILI